MYLEDGVNFVSGSGDGMIKMWNFRSQKLVFTFQGHEDGVRTLFYLKDLHYFVSGGNDSVIKIWDLTQNLCKERLFENDGNILCFQHVSKLNWLFSAGQEKKTKYGTYTNTSK